MQKLEYPTNVVLGFEKITFIGIHYSLVFRPIYGFIIYQLIDTPRNVTILITYQNQMISSDCYRIKVEYVWESIFNKNKIYLYCKLSFGMFIWWSDQLFAKITILMRFFMNFNYLFIFYGGCTRKLNKGLFQIFPTQYSSAGHNYYTQKVICVWII